VPWIIFASAVSDKTPFATLDRIRHLVLLGFRSDPGGSEPAVSVNPGARTWPNSVTAKRHFSANRTAGEICARAGRAGVSQFFGK